MGAGAYQPPDGFMTMTEAQVRLGVSKATLQRIVRAGKLETYEDPRNGRVRLVRRDELQKLMEPIREQVTHQQLLAANLSAMSDDSSPEALQRMADLDAQFKAGGPDIERRLGMTEKPKPAEPFLQGGRDEK